MDLQSPASGDEEARSFSSSLENDAEIARQLLRHRLLSELMGGILPSSLDLSQVRHVLDVGCGAGGWAYDMAWRYPHVHVTGIDTSAYFIQQAQVFADRGLTNVSYVLQDMHLLPGGIFSAEMFDLIHSRFLVGKVILGEFPGLLRSLVGLCRVGGLFVWTEAEMPITTSAAFAELCAMVLDGLKAAGRAFSPGNSLGVTALMSRWLRDAGCRIAQDGAYAIEVSAGTKGYDMFVREVEVFGQVIQPFLLEMGVTMERCDEVFRRVLREIRQEEFCGICYLRTVVGVKVTPLLAP